ncbi:MAG: hypothetical protein IJ801_02665 [Lachnospiraceae bacterium]|nr:hypothetical protein [Lachnospiraceae bacterium]
MKQTKTKLLFLMTLMASFVLTACGQQFDASRYVKACLDANTHGEFADYVELTNISEEDAAKQYNDLLDDEVSYLDDYNIDADTKQKFRDLFENMYKNFKYEVGEATKNDDNSYSVPVTTYKMQIFGDISADMETYITNYYQEQMDAGNTPSTDEAYAVVVDYLYDYISKNMENITYADPVTTTVTVAPTDNVYSISDSELQDLLSSMLDFENLQ